MNTRVIKVYKEDNIYKTGARHIKSGQTNELKL